MEKDKLIEELDEWIERQKLKLQIKIDRKKAALLHRLEKLKGREERILQIEKRRDEMRFCIKI